MRLEQLRAFEAVARVGHFTRAAEELFVAQPSLSRQIAALEGELGAPLLERGPAGASLTRAGEVLLPIARRMLADAESARRELDDLAGLRRGRVRIGAPPTLCVSVLAEVLAAFRAQHPGVRLEVTEAGSHALAEALSEGRLDLALTVDRGPVGAAVTSEPLFVEELVVASQRTDADAAAADARAGIPRASRPGRGLPAVLVADSHGGAPGSAAGSPHGARPKGRGVGALLGGPVEAEAPVSVPDAGGPLGVHVAESVSLAQLAELPQVAFNRSYDLRQATDSAFAAVGLDPNVVVEGAEMDAVLRFVERGLGVAVVPATILLDRPRLTASRLVKPSLTRTAALSVRAGGSLDAAGRAMRDQVLETVREMTEPGAALGSLVTPA